MTNFEKLFQSRWISIFSILRHAGKFGRLYVRLLRDARVPVYLKLLFFASIFYIVSPLDFIPESLFLFFGIIDDVGLFVVMLKLFLRLCPQNVVQEHVSAINQ